MSNIVITSTLTGVKIDMGIYGTAVNFSKEAWSKSNNPKVRMNADGTIIEVRMPDGSVYPVAYTATVGALIVDSVDGLAPISNDDLFTKLFALA